MWCSLLWNTSYHFYGKGGPTEYENLIVLCPNCHTRVHSEDVPSKEQLKQYKLKLEIVYSLPIISKLTKNEKDLIKEISSRDSNNEILKFNKRYYEEVPASSQEEAKQIFRDKIGYFNLELADIIKSEYGMVVTSASGKTVGVNLYIRATSKAAKWISYLRQTNRLIFLDWLNTFLPPTHLKWCFISNMSGLSWQLHYKIYFLSLKP